MVAIAGGVACGAAAACSSFDADPATIEPGVDAAALTDTGSGGDIDAMSPDAFASDGADGADGGVDRTGMVIVNGFFIDKHEVTFGEYSDFVTALGGGTPAAASLPARCAGKMQYGPTYTCTSPGVRTGFYPVVCVDWCDAFAYCQFRGKRLCGKIGGGPSDPLASVSDQWSVACGGAAGTAYPYGDAPDASACVTSDLDAGGYPSRVETHLKCQGSVSGLFDMSGNVWEWSDSCVAGPNGGKDVCLIRGGSVANPTTSATCSSAETHSHDFVLYNVGFRCCSDP